ncbi:MAG: hypothetical protein KJ718_01920 [Nanoarchaeota archaeon]|nr:hypothetical protein [Nanoarchaeota archaeon]
MGREPALVSRKREDGPYAVDGITSVVDPAELRKAGITKPMNNPEPLEVEEKRDNRLSKREMLRRQRMYAVRQNVRVKGYVRRVR